MTVTKRKPKITKAEAFELPPGWEWRVVTDEGWAGKKPEKGEKSEKL